MLYPPTFSNLMAANNTAYLNAIGARAQLRSLESLDFRNDFDNIVDAGYTNALSALANTVLGSGIPSVAPVSIAFGVAGAPPGPPFPGAPLPDGYPFVPALVPYSGFESPALFNVLLGAYNVQLLDRAAATDTNEVITDRFGEIQRAYANGTLLVGGAAVFAP